MYSDARRQGLVELVHVVDLDRVLWLLGLLLGSFTRWWLWLLLLLLLLLFVGNHERWRHVDRTLGVE